MSRKYQAISDLQEKLKTIIGIDDRKQRLAAGLWLENECRKVDDEFNILGSLDEHAIIEFNAVLQALFGYVLYDALENEELIDFLPTSYEGDKDKLIRDLIDENRKAET